MPINKVFCQDYLARAIIEAGLFRTDGPFELKLHEDYPEAPKSPFYLDLRKAPSKENKVWQYMVKEVCDLLRPLGTSVYGDPTGYFGYLATIPISGTALFQPVAFKLGIPALIVRTEAKKRGGKNRIDGDYDPGDTVLVLDDLITRADSKLQAAAALDEAGLVVKEFVVLIDREQGGKEELEAHGYKLHSVFRFSELLEFWLEEGLINQHVFDDVSAYPEQLRQYLATHG